MSKGRDLVKRNAEGLMPVQVEYLQLLSEGNSEKEARIKLNLSNDRVTRWGRKDEAYIKVYDAYSHEVVESVHTQARMLSEKAAATVDELLEDMKPITVSIICSECDHKNTTQVQVRDSGVRARIAEMVWKATGVLKDVHRIEGEVGVTHMTAGQRMALALWNDGKGARVSEQAKRELRNMGLIDDEEAPVDIVDGEVVTPEE